MTDEQEIKDRLLARVRAREKSDLTTAEREVVAHDVMTFMAEECELSLEQVHGFDSLDELGVDSLTFLELFEELRSQYNLDLEIRTVARYGRENPVQTVDDLVAHVCLFLEGKLELSAEDPVELTSNSQDESTH
jgi:acyl carrier protein